MTTPEPWTVGDTPPSPGSHLTAFAALNADIEVKQYVQLPDDQEPSVSDLITNTHAGQSSPSAPAPSFLLDGNLRDAVHLGLIGRGVTGGESVGDGDGDGSFPLPSHGLSPISHTNHPPDLPIVLDSHQRALQRLISHAVPQDKLPSLIETIFSDSDVTKVVDRLQENNAQAFIDVIDGVLDVLDPASRVRRRCVKSLYNTCARYSLLPGSLQIAVSYDPAGIPHSHGGFANVWKGNYSGLEVAVKVLKTSFDSDLEKITRVFCKEFVTWKTLRHPNVLPLLGVVMTEGRFAMVSEWMTHGNITKFVRENFDANRFELLGDVARGLIYMHGQGMVHGDLKGANILVDKTCHARLADFGLLSIISDYAASNSYAQGGTTRWMSPELLDPESQDHHQTKHSDCYALGMVMYEVLSGQVPFYRHANLVIPWKVVGGYRPERPQGAEGMWFTDDVWGLLERCWVPQPGDRPSIEGVLQRLEKISESWTPPPPSLASPPTSSSLTRKFSDTTTMESMDQSVVSSPSQTVSLQPPEQPDIDEPARIFNRIQPNYPGEHIPLHARNPSSTRGLLREDIDEAGTGSNDFGSRDGGDTFPRPTIQPNAEPIAGGNDGPVIDSTRSKPVAVTRNIPHAVQPSQWNHDATPASMHQDMVEAAEDADDIPALLATRRTRTEEDASRAWREIRQGLERLRTPALATPRLTDASISLREVANWDGKSLGIYQVLAAAFNAEDYLDCIKYLPARNIDPLSYINSLDKIIDSLPSDLDLRKRCIRALRKTCGLNGILPTSHVISFTLCQPSQRAFASGGYSDIWRLADKRNPDLVFAVKSLRVYEQDYSETINKKYCKEVIIRKRAKHPNILSIEGVAPNMFEFCMVSRWMVNGSMPGYVKKHPEVNRLELLVGVTRGLDYLHSNEIIHGDLKSPNILIDEEGTPRLDDFGLCSVTQNVDSVNASTPNYNCTIRYSAPELFDIGVAGFKRRSTKKSDLYSLSMIIVELATGEMPFPEHMDHNVIILVGRGRRPPKPLQFDAPGITSAVWKIAEKCWHEKPNKRPEVDVVLQYLEDLANPGIKQTRWPLLQQLREVFGD